MGPTSNKEKKITDPGEVVRFISELVPLPAQYAPALVQRQTDLPPCVTNRLLAGLQLSPYSGKLSFSLWG